MLFIKKKKKKKNIYILCDPNSINVLLCQLLATGLKWYMVHGLKCHCIAEQLSVGLPEHEFLSPLCTINMTCN